MAERAILLAAAGVFVGVLGLLIKYAGMTELIAGYDPERVTDEEGLSNFVGVRAILVGVLTLALAALERWEPTADANWYWVVYVIVVFAIAAQMIRGARRYEAPPENAQTE